MKWSVMCPVCDNDWEEETTFDPGCGETGHPPERTLDADIVKCPQCGHELTDSERMDAEQRAQEEGIPFGDTGTQENKE